MTRRLPISLDNHSLADSSTTETKADDVGYIYTPVAQGNLGLVVLDLGSISGDLAAHLTISVARDEADTII
jgi:hypothetical protein